MKFIAFILNFPWTIIGLLLALMSVPYSLHFDGTRLAVIFNVRSFWWYRWLPGKNGVRAMANGHVVQLGPKALNTDLAHELVHVEQAIREPLIKPFLYEIETLKNGYRQNKYEREAYDRTGDTYVGSEK